MKYGVNRNTLLVIAGVVWITAGLNIFRIGILSWCKSMINIQNILMTLFVFLLFFCFIFRKQFKRHKKRIASKEKKKNCPFSFFDLKGWIIMIFMIALGATIRHFSLLPIAFIAIFYTGLSLALTLTGVLFIRYRCTHNKSDIL